MTTSTQRTPRKQSIDAPKKAAAPSRARSQKTTAPVPVARKGRQASTDAALTKERIVAAAIDQIDRNGVMGFSLRDVARSLGVYPAAVYWHVATRDDLLASVVEATMADVAPAPGKLPWQDWFRELFTRVRAVMRKHPNVAQLVGGQLVANASLSPGMIDRILAVLVSAGCKDEHIVELYNVVIAAMVGFSTLEFASVPTDDPAAWADQLQQKTHEIRALEYPTLARYLPAMANRAFIVRWQNGTDAPMDSSFKTYVEIVIAGMEKVLARK
ncbi:TetR/AcrR family transcriptional regulator C-terminal domain-containing protein [Paraburkholderia youngii]|uniref:TetR/AcrR family transcriptional regulator C-terminal domain-containing protein n=1 Tax=Paraburkholderia youngii TaxID=2782701 RepID=UPI0015921244|nr:TetR/AcrR family transcriptional regulator C-terminal domain-containing protein [Paraburkholderia youngii]NUX57653.1 TetR family transcriptional regulator [Paraburkholderia youngii]